MKKYIFILLILAGSYSAIYSQKLYAGIHCNLLYYRINGITNVSDDPAKPLFERTDDIHATAVNVSAMVKYDYPVYKFNDDMSIGVNANIGIGGQSSNKLLGISQTLIFDFPEYITFRYGNFATRDSKEGMGYAFGAGYNYTLAIFPFQSVSVMAEVSYKKIGLRFNYSVKKYTYYYYYTSEGGIPAATIRPIGVELLLMF